MKKYTDLFVFTMSLFCSILMHISETKHGLNPLPKVLNKWSYTFLNADRTMAIIAICYFSKYLSRDLVHKLKNYLALALLSSFIGEQTSNLWLYSIMHTIWHFVVFYYGPTQLIK